MAARPGRLGTIGGYAIRYRRFYAVGALALFLVNLCDVALPLVLKFAIDDIVLLRGLLPLGAVAGAYLALVLMQGLYRYFWRIYFIGASHRVANDLRRRLFEHLERLSPTCFNQARTGDIMSRATADLEAVRQFFSLGLLLTMDTLMYLAVMPPIMFSLSPRLTLYTLAPLPLIPLLVAKVGRAIHERSARAQALQGDMSAMVEETAAGIRVVKSFAQEERQLERLRELSDRTLAANMAVSNMQGALQPTVSLLMSIGVFIVILLGGRAAIAGAISIGSFVAFQHYLLKIAWPMQAIGMTFGLYQRAFASMARVDEVLAEVPDIADGPETEALARVERGAISLEAARVSYPGGKAPALDGLTLEIPAGRTLALVGPVGSGKTTLLNLLPRLVEASAGAVRVDGRDVRRYPLAALRGAIAYVPQETFLFADTIAENIAFGAPGASREAIREAASIAQVLAEIEALPGGLDALLGERGVTLSGGQRQRIAIARAVLRKPRILLLDDCLSSVDADTEARVLQGLREVMRGRTCIFASHRLAATRDADEIVVLDDGRVAERGTHAALLEKPGGTYAGLWARQRLQSELEEAA
ncbi:MAG TPA: ABC transporter ATP-binding protein [Planctomycetota bacterium]|nr:ABC transporter ATP-binding protein [Planctomycetota bacterium]